MSLGNLKNIFQSQGTTTGLPQALSQEPVHTSAADDHTTHPAEFSQLDNFTTYSPSSIDRLITGTNSESAFPTNYTPLNTLVGGKFSNGDVLGKHGWPDLYEPNHKSISISHPSERSRNPFQPRGGNLNIKHSANTFLGIPTRTSVLGAVGKLLGAIGLTDAEDMLDGREPYIVSRIPRDSGDFLSGRTINFGNRNLPVVRATTDTLRVAKYMTSAQGLAEIFLKQADLFIPQTVVRKGDELVRVPQRFNTGYNPFATLIAVSPIARLLGHGPNFLNNSGLTGKYADSGQEGGGLSNVKENLSSKLIIGDTPEYHINDTFTKSTADGDSDGLFSMKNLSSFLSVGGTVKKTSSGDKMTLAKIIKGNHLSSNGAGTMIMKDESNVEETIPVNIESKRNGMPFYFKDLRDNSYIFFRAYLNGITESVSPSWAEHNYIGRSEPVYTYERAQREISFNLLLYANTESELGAIYAKMNKLTSLCYPEYAKDEFLSSTLSTDSIKVTKTRMKPPLMKMRLGDLYGKSRNENGSDGGLIGFISSLTYSIPDEATYETEDGKKVPKYIQVALGYKVIHGEVPEMTTQFYGYKGEQVSSSPSQEDDFDFFG